MREYLAYSCLIVILSYVSSVNSQLGPIPPRFSVPAGAIPVPVPLQYRQERLVNNGGPNAGFVRIRRPVLARAGPSTLQALQQQNSVDDAKPVTEEPESAETPAFVAQPQFLPQAQAQIQPKPILPAVLYSYDENGQELNQRQHDFQTTPRYIQHQTQEHIAPTTLRTTQGSAQRFAINATPKPIQPKPVLRARPEYREPRPQFEAEHEQPVRRPHFESIQPKPRPHHHHEDEREKKPVAQILRKYREENEDGTITWGFENDDGSYKEEIIGNDCITRGRYGYVDPDGVKREYNYETGIACDPNKRDLEEPEEEEREDGAALQDNGAYVDYQSNQMVLPDGKRINLNNVGKNKIRRPNY